MPRGERAHPHFHDIVDKPYPGWVGGMKTVVTDDGSMGSYVSYMMHLGPPMSPEAQSHIAGAVGRLWDFWHASPPATAADENQFIDRFAAAVIHGTILNEEDPLGLFWPRPSKKKARQVLRIVTEFTDFCAQSNHTALLNPVREARFIERILSYQAQAHRKKYDLLAHLSTTDEKHERAAMARRVRLPRANKVMEKDPPYFPSDRTEELLNRGFRRSRTGPYWKQYDIRGMMLFILQRFGGLRSSEPLHLFVRDVAARPVAGTTNGQMTARVSLFHPTDGLTEYIDPITKAHRRGKREEYLRVVHGREPRNSLVWPSAARVGWKDLLIEDAKLQCSFVTFFPQEWGVKFYQLYTLYVTHVRPAKLDHPYLFVSGPKGDHAPLSREAWSESFERAVRAIDLEPCKEAGTTPHGLRHAYGQMLDKYGMSEKFIQIAMHHKSIESQKAYTLKTKEQFQAELDKAQQRVTAAITGPGSMSAASMLPLPGAVTP